MTAPLKISIGFATLLLGLVARPACAEDVARVTVPFPFVVNGQTLPAGPYDVRTDEQNPAVVVVEGRHDASARAMVVTVADNDLNTTGPVPSLTFVRRDGQYLLSVIRETGDRGREIVTR